ncbi:MAG: DUF2846 domain-containing protein [Caulobacteraceae bacterium]|nr:DUF2846 domain-containing protein [Caulobacteraceae bacterium]
MNKYVWPAVWGVLVAFVLGFLMSLVSAAAQEPMGFAGWFPPTFFGALTFYLLANLAGNRKAANATSAERDAALALRPPAGQGQILVYREGFVGKAAGLNVSVDGAVRVQLKSPRFVVLPVAPGNHTVTTAFGGLAGAQNNAGEQTVSVAGGETVVLRATLSMGLLKNTVRLERMDDHDAVRRRLRGVTMVKPEA